MIIEIDIDIVKRANFNKRIHSLKLLNELELIRRFIL